VNTPDGRAFVLRTERTGSKPEKIQSQTLFEVKAESVKKEPEAIAAGLTFQLLDEVTGEPIEEVQITLETGSKTSMDDSEAADGLYAYPSPLSHDPDGQLSRITLDANGYLGVTLEVDLSVATDLGAVFLDPGITVQGLVIDSSTGAPVSGAEVTSIRRHPWGALAADHFGYRNTTETDAQGRFRLTGLEEGSGCFRITAEHRIVRAFPLDSLLPEESRDLGALYLENSAAVAGRAVDGDQKPVADATVELRAGNLRNPCLRLTQGVDEEGIFAFPAVAPGPYWLAVIRDHKVLASRKVEVEEGEPQDLGEIEARLRTFKGRVLLNGEPLNNASVTIAEDQAGEFLPPPVFIASPVIGSPTGGRQTIVSDLPNTLGASLDEGGYFETQGYLPPGEAWLSVTTQEGALLRQTVKVSPGLAPVEMTLDIQGEPIRGLVLDPQGDPVEGAAVSLLAGTRALRSTESGADGVFLLPASPVGSLVLEAQSREGVVTVWYDAQEEAFAPVELILQPEASGRILLEPPLGPSGAYVRTVALISDGQRTHILRTLDAPYAVTGLRPGVYKVLAFSRGVLRSLPTVDLRQDREQRVSIDVAEGEQIAVELEEEQAGRSVRLLTEDGYSASPLLGYVGRALEVALDGTLSLPTVEEGRWVLAYHDGSQDHRLALTIGSGAEQRHLRIPFP